MAIKKKPTQSKSSKTNEENAPQDSTTSASEESANISGLQGLGPIPRVVSLIVLTAVLLLTGVLFFRVMAGFIVPLFLAAVLAVIFEPLHKWSLIKLPGKPYMAALLTTALISLLVLAPLAWIGWEAFHETRGIVDWINKSHEQQTVAQDGALEGEGPSLVDGATGIDPSDPEDNLSGVLSLGANVERIVEWIQTYFYSDFDLAELVQEAKNFAANNAIQLGLTTFSALFSAALGLAIMIFALYSFFADGPAMLQHLMRLSPMEDRYELELLERFATVSRAVVVATLLTALVQGLLGGIGYWFALPAGSPIFLLTVLTLLLAIVPFVGATAGWAPVSAWVFFLTPDDGGFWPGIGLAVYCFCIVSSVDNVLKPFILSGQSNLHPLLALLSVLGGIQFLGPIGILVGPMLVVFMQALLEMFRKEIDTLKKEG